MSNELLTILLHRSNQDPVHLSLSSIPDKTEWEALRNQLAGMLMMLNIQEQEAAQEEIVENNAERTDSES